jgi:hypothetical protein
MDVHRKRSRVVVIGEYGRVQLADGLCRPRHRASMQPPYELGAPAELNPYASDLRLYRKTNRVYSVSPGQGMIICVRGGT